MIPVERALDIVLSVVEDHGREGAMPVERVPLAECLSRVLGEDVLSDADSPRFDKAIRDGFAVRAEDVRQVPAELKVIGESRAGKATDLPVGPGEACEIMTGAPLPAGADAVVMVERTERPEAARVRILKSVRQNEGLLRQGAEARRGDRVLEVGQAIGIAEIGLLASVGIAAVPVSRKPRVAVIATGDELVDVDTVPAPGEIRNSNSYTLLAQCVAAGAHPVLLGIGRDNIEDLSAKIGVGLTHDILLVSGGVSMGKYDLVEDVFAEFGVRVYFNKVAMKPGKPTVFGYRDGTFVFGLPGNPVSTMVSFQMFVRPVIQSLMGSRDIRPFPLKATLDAPAKCDPERAALVPALVQFDGSGYRIRTSPWKGSSDLVGLSRANALILIPRQAGTLEPGDTAQFLPLGATWQNPNYA